MDTAINYMYGAPDIGAFERDGLRVDFERLDLCRSQVIGLDIHSQDASLDPDIVQQLQTELDTIIELGRDPGDVSTQIKMLPKAERN